MAKRIRILSVFLLLSALISLPGCGIFDAVKEKKQKAEIEKAVKAYYETKVEAFEEENKTLTDVDVVFIGDSLTDGYDLETYYPDYKTVNRGIGGDTTFGVEKRLAVSLYDVKPKVVVMLIGGNNLYTMFDNYESIVADIKENLPDSELVLLSLTALGKTLADKNEVVVAQNEQIKAIAEKYDCPYVDLFSALYNPETGEICESYTTDGAHLTWRGYVVVTAQVTPVLRNILNP